MVRKIIDSSPQDCICDRGQFVELAQQFVVKLVFPHFFVVFTDGLGKVLISQEKVQVSIDRRSCLLVETSKNLDLSRISENRGHVLDIFEFQFGSLLSPFSDQFITILKILLILRFLVEMFLKNKFSLLSYFNLFFLKDMRFF